MCLVALEQYLDIGPWEGLRSRALSPKSRVEFFAAPGVTKYSTC